LTPETDSTVDLTSILLSWESSIDPDPGDSVHYTAFLDETAAFDSADSVITDETGVWTPFLTPGSNWYWKVKAEDDFGSVTWSALGNFHVDENAGPRPVSDLHLTPINATDISLDWTAIPGADSYHVFASSEPYTGFTLLTTVPAPTCIHLNALTEGYYFYKVITEDDDYLILDTWRNLAGEPLTTKK